MKRGMNLLLFFATFIGLVFSLSFISPASQTSPISNDLHLDIQTTDSNGTIINGTFSFVFNISTNSDCTNIVYTNSSTLTTNSRGMISYYIQNVSLDFNYQYWLCHYRDGVLTNISKIVRVPYAFSARNVTLSGVGVDTNFNLGNYNITTSGTISTPQICLNGVCQTTWSSGSSSGSGIIASGNNSNGYYIQFADGTMMEWGNSSASVSTLQNSNIGTYGWSYYMNPTIQLTFPVAFISSPNVVSSTNAWTSSVNTITTTGFVFNLQNDGVSTSVLNWYAIGRWTALTNITQNTTSWAVNGNGDTVLFDTTKKVGIGTSTPSSKFEVVGNANVTGNLTLGVGRIMYNSSANNYIYYNTTDWLTFGTGSVNYTNLAWTNQSNVFSGVQNFSKGVNVSGLLYVNSSNVGIGTSSPQATLDVRGTVNIGNPSYIYSALNVNSSGNVAGFMSSGIAQNASSDINFGEGSSPFNYRMGVLRYLNGAGTASNSKIKLFNYGDSESSGINIVGGGLVGIGMNPGHTLDIVGNDAALASSTVWINRASDSRLKTNISNFTDGMNIISQINPINYNFNGITPEGNDTVNKIGLFADQLTVIAPYMAVPRNYTITQQDMEIINKIGIDAINKNTPYPLPKNIKVNDTVQLYGWDANALNFIFINAFKEQQKEIEQQNETINQMQSDNQAMKQSLCKLGATEWC